MGEEAEASRLLEARVKGAEEGLIEEAEDSIVEGVASEVVIVANSHRAVEDLKGQTEDSLAEDPFSEQQLINSK